MRGACYTRSEIIPTPRGGMYAADFHDDAQDTHDDDGWSRPDRGVSRAAWARAVDLAEAGGRTYANRRAYASDQSPREGPGSKR